MVETEVQVQCVSLSVYVLSVLLVVWLVVRSSVWSLSVSVLSVLLVVGCLFVFVCLVTCCFIFCRSFRSNKKKTIFSQGRVRLLQRLRSAARQAVPPRYRALGGRTRVPERQGGFVQVNDKCILVLYNLVVVM